MSQQETSTEREQLCQGCGRCCYEKLSFDDLVVITDVPCQHYEEQTRQCRVYHKRHSEEVRCITVEQGIAVGAFPADCPYLCDTVQYQGAITIDEAEELLEISRDELNNLARVDV